MRNIFSSNNNLLQLLSKVSASGLRTKIIVQISWNIDRITWVFMDVAADARHRSEAARVSQQTDGVETLVAT